MKENKYSRVQALKEINSSLHKQLDTLFGKYPKFKAGSDQYKKGLKYIECTRNYTTEGKEYFEQLSEKKHLRLEIKQEKYMIISQIRGEYSSLSIKVSTIIQSFGSSIS